MEKKIRIIEERLSHVLSNMSLVIIGLLGIVALIIGFFTNATQPLYGGIALGFGSGFLGYVVTTALHTWATDAANRRFLEESLRLQIKAVLESVQQETYNQIAAQFPRFVPANYFPASNASNPEFERDLLDSLTKTRNYIFRGVTARHVPIFLERAKPAGVNVSIFILHPEETQQIILYALDRFGDNITSIERTGLVRKIQQEIYYAIVGLYDICHVCPMTLKMHRGPVFYRTEIFDDRCLVSYYVGKPRTTYPITYVYNSDSFFYQAFFKDAYHVSQLDGPSLSLNGRVTEEEVAEFLKSIGCTESVSDLRSAFDEFKTSFIKPAK